MNNIVTAKNLSFGYGKEKIIRDITLQIPKNSIFGFVGPNGAGKSTTIKLLLGLLTPESGSIEIFGNNLLTHRTESLKKIGSLVEMPSLYPHLTAEENLEVVRKIYRVPVSQIDAVLRSTGIANAKTKKVKEFSLGMKQRLGIALSLLHSPQLLILDEPINGLDPEGIQEFRIFLKQLVDEQGITVLLSSHILSELEQVVTNVGIIAKGEIKYQGTLDELKQLQSGMLVVDVSDSERATMLLNHKHLPVKRRMNGTLSLPITNKQTAAFINTELVQAGIDVFEMRFEQPNLESVFFELIQAGDKS